MSVYIRSSKCSDYFRFIFSSLYEYSSCDDVHFPRLKKRSIYLTNRRIIYLTLNENDVKLLGCLENLHAEYATV